MTVGQIAGGFFIDEDGQVWKLPYRTKDGVPQVVRLGQVQRDAQGGLVPQSVTRLLKSEIDPGYTYVAMPLMEPGDMVVLQDTLRPRPLTITCALATQHGVISLGMNASAKMISIYHGRRGTEAAFFDWDHGVLEMLSTYYYEVRAGEEAASRIAYAIGQTFYGAGWRDLSERITLLVYDEDGSVAPSVRKACSTWALRNACGGFDITVKGREDVLSGALVRTSVLYGELRQFCSLDATWYAIDLGSEGHRYPLLYKNTTVPTANTEHLELRPGDTPYLELASPTDIRRVTRWPLPAALLPRDRDERVVPLDVTIDVDASFRMSLVVNDDSGFAKIMSFSEIQSAACAPKPGAAMQPAAPAPQPHVPVTKSAGSVPQPLGDLSDELMDLISILDDVDLGIASLPKRDRQSGAGQGLVALQKRLLTALEKRGAEYYPAVGRLFDPQIHQAMGVVSYPGVPNNCVVEEVRRGFMYRGRVIRYSLVKVATSR